MIIRPATKKDIETFSDLPLKPTLLCWCGEIDGEIVGLAGFAFSGKRWWGFCDLREKARAHKFAIVRAAKMAMAEAKAKGIRYIYAEVDTREKNAVRWLTSLGFTIDPRTQYLYRWRNG